MSVKGDLGDGPQCPESPEHGRLYTVGQNLWCPVSQALYGPSVWSEVDRAFRAGKLIRAGSVSPPKPEPVDLPELTVPEFDTW